MESTPSDRKSIAIVAGISVVAVLILMAYTVLTQEADTFSEVWVEEVTEQGQELSFSFGIANHEAAEASYEYSISMNDLVQERGTEVIPKEESRIIEKTLQLAEGAETQRVLITVFNPETTREYTLWFWAGEQA